MVEFLGKWLMGVTCAAMILALAEEKDCAYVNVAEAVTGEDGCLRPELTSDGVHLNTAGCRIWLDCLRTHPV